MLDALHTGLIFCSRALCSMLGGACRDQMRSCGFASLAQAQIALLQIIKLGQDSPSPGSAHQRAIKMMYAACLLQLHMMPLCRLQEQQ